uniref:Ribosome assembly protein METTL17, mitochondrial n=1 Tax=Neovison vison TaxID=452646 RepID=A0A8C7A4E5_NEOVI
MATVRGLRHLLTCSRWRRGSGDAPQSRTLAAVVPGISQVDNNSDFLGKTPHRRHPGILQLPCIKFLLLESSMPNVEKQVQALTNYLWSRRLPVEPQELQRRAVHLEKKFLENPDLGQVEEKLHEAVLRALRKTTYHWQELSYNESLSLVYMAARLDGGFAAVSRAFHEIQARVPEFQPQTLMDFGSGTGSVTWAAHSAWGQSLREYLCVDSSAAMLVLAEKLLKGGSESGEPYVPGVFFRQFLPVSPKVQFDVVVSAFSLSELPSKADRTELVQTLWRKTSHFLGKEKSPLDPRPGFVFAPCPHELPCPQLTASKPLACSFSQAYHCIPFSWVCFLGMLGNRGQLSALPEVLLPLTLLSKFHICATICCPGVHSRF